MTDRTQEAKRLLGEIRYQVFIPAGSTVGDCTRKCGNLARGSMVCAACLVEEMRALLPKAGWWPASYWQRCIEQRTIEQKIMEIAGPDEPTTTPKKEK